MAQKVTADREIKSGLCILRLENSVNPVVNGSFFFETGKDKAAKRQ